MEGKGFLKAPDGSVYFSYDSSLSVARTLHLKDLRVCLATGWAAEP